MEDRLAVEFVENFTHSILLFDLEGQLLGANRAAVERFHLPDRSEKKCHELLYGRKQRCPKCPLGFSRPPFTISQIEAVRDAQSGRTPSNPCVVTMGAVPRTTSGLAVYKILSDPPQALLYLRKLHEFARELESRTDYSRDALVAWALEYLVPELGFESARYWEIVTHDGEQVLECKLQRDSVSDLQSLRGQIMAAPGRRTELSWWAINKREVTYICEDEDVVRQLFDCKGSELARPARPFGEEELAFLYYGALDEVEQVVVRTHDDNTPHSWLDLPLIDNDKPFGKISVSHPRPGQPFSREECETASLFTHILNQHLARGYAVARHRLEAMASISHELRHPVELASHSVGFLKGRLLGEKNLDLIKHFTLRNLENALRHIHNLNDAQNLYISQDSHSAEPAYLVTQVIHPIVDMIRHQIYMELMAKNKIELSLEHLDAIKEYNNQFRWHFTHDYEIFFEEPLRTLRLHLRESRLQEVFYNLVVNAVKYRRPDEGMTIRLQLAGQSDESFPSDRNFGDYYVVQFVDYGMGVGEQEAEEIFEHGKTGSAARRAGKPGNGIGLYIAREIAVGWGGDLILGKLSEPTRFDLLIPRKTSVYGWWEQ